VGVAMFTEQNPNTHDGELTFADAPRQTGQEPPTASWLKSWFMTGTQ
jgi:hypothetical protein